MFLRLLATAECLNNNNKKKITKKESLTILAILMLKGMFGLVWTKEKKNIILVRIEITLAF